MSDTNTPTLADYARRMRSLVEEDVRVAADLRELAKEMRGDGYSAATLKALVKAMVLDDDGNPKPLQNLKTKIQDAAIYAEALGIGIDGFGETKRFDTDVFGDMEREDGGWPIATPHDIDGVVIEPATEIPSAPSQGLNGGQPSTASSDAVPAADASPRADLVGQSERAPDPIPVQHRIVPPTRELGVTTDIPDFLDRRQKVTG